MKWFRKYVGAIFLLAAGLLFFAHAIIPHHQHNLQLCTETHHCNNASFPHTQDSGCPGDQHDDEYDNCCLLNQLVIVPANQWKPENTFLFLFKIPAPGICSPDFSARNFASVQPLTTIKYFQVPPPVYFFYASSPAGLRAPPVS